MRTIIVEVKNEILGDSVFWKGTENNIRQIRNIPARMAAKQLIETGKKTIFGMWHVYFESPHNACQALKQNYPNKVF